MRIVKRIRGFSLVELVVTVAVLAILASVGYPMYTKQMQKARRADAKIALHSIALAQEQFFTVNGFYADILSTLSLDASGVDAATGTTRKGYYVVTVASEDADGQTFDLTALAPEDSKQRKDKSCRTFMLDELGVKSAKDDDDVDADNCW